MYFDESIFTDSLSYVWAVPICAVFNRVDQYLLKKFNRQSKYITTLSELDDSINCIINPPNRNYWGTGSYKTYIHTLNSNIVDDCWSLIPAKLISEPKYSVKLIDDDPILGTKVTLDHLAANIDYPNKNINFYTFNNSLTVMENALLIKYIVLKSKTIKLSSIAYYILKKHQLLWDKIVFEPIRLEVIKSIKI